MTAVSTFQNNLNNFTGVLPDAVSGMAVVRHFILDTNNFSGALPEHGIQSMMALTVFHIFHNSFTGYLPSDDMRAMRAVTSFSADDNRFQGALPDSGIRAMLAVIYFNIDTNGFTGMLPHGGILAMRVVIAFGIHNNRFKGILPDAVSGMMAVSTFSIRINSFTGSLPESGLRSVTHFNIADNSFSGALPDRGMHAIRAVTFFEASTNSFTRMLPQVGIRGMLAVTDFALNQNCFTGALPTDVTRAMAAVTYFNIAENRFTGDLPGRGFMAVTGFNIHTNGFTGTLPTDSIRGMLALTSFDISRNRFSGALPSAGIRSMRAVAGFRIHTNRFRGLLPEGGLMAVAVFNIHENSFSGTLSELSFGATLLTAFLQHNCFAGTLPPILRSTSTLQVLDASWNYLEGTIPPELEAPFVFMSHNQLLGSLPKQLLANGRTSNQKLVVANGLHHEGTIPASAGRLTIREIVISFGHGLTGVVPRIPGTLAFLSLWENGLEGHLPELHIKNKTVLLVHANRFSCALPRHGGVEPKLKRSIALVGNRFAQTRQLPAWITRVERPGDMFCVSNRQGARFVMLFMCGLCVFTLVFISVGPLKAQAKYTRFACAKVSWYETSKQQGQLFAVSLFLLGLYRNMISLTCTVVFDHLRFHFDGATNPVAVCLVVAAHLCFYQAACSFRHRRATVRVLPVHQEKTRTQLATMSSKTCSLWFLVCVLTSAPGVLYSVVKAVPGFLQVSKVWRWIIGNTIAVFSGLLTSFGLELVAQKLSGPGGDGTKLQLVGLLLASILLPGLVTILCHADCIGAWTSFWAPCGSSSAFFGTTFKARVEATARAGLRLGSKKKVAFYVEPASRLDICSFRWQLNRRECTEAVVERLAWLLYPKFVHFSFTMAAFRILNGRLRVKRMKIKDANMLLNYTWLVVTSFGPCLPILSGLIAVLTNIYSVLLFGTDLQLLDMDESQEHKATAQSFGFSSAAVLALVLQSSNLGM